MAETKNRLGRVPCAHCGQPVMVRENAAGTLSLACEECGFSAFAKAGERCNADIRGKLPRAAGAPVPAATPAAAPKPAPAAAKGGAAFSLGAL